MIRIDPGHGGEDSGALGEFSKEAEINLTISKILYSILSYQNYNPALTRSKDIYPTWKERVQSSQDDLFISLHCNAVENQKVSGIETYHYPTSEAGARLADLVQTNLIKATERKDRGVKKEGGLYVLRETKCPAVLVETGFISNAEEEKLLNSISYQVKIGLAIVAGIKSYLE